MLSLIPPSTNSLATAHSLPSERRAKFRYALNLSVRFRPLSGSHFLGAGRAVNMSSGGVLVLAPLAPGGEISVGAWVEVSIEWPSLLDGRIPLQLIVVGRVVRRRAAQFAASVERYQFRTVGSTIPPHFGLKLHP